MKYCTEKFETGLLLKMLLIFGPNWGLLISNCCLSSKKELAKIYVYENFFLRIEDVSSSPIVCIRIATPPPLWNNKIQLCETPLFYWNCNPSILLKLLPIYIIQWWFSWTTRNEEESMLNLRYKKIFLVLSFDTSRSWEKINVQLYMHHEELKLVPKILTPPPISN